MRREDIAAVVPPALHLGDDVKKLVIFQEFVFNIDRDFFCILGKI